jgi:signal transduction histidine kinase/CheY-like chemotaxis protein
MLLNIGLMSLLKEALSHLSAPEWVKAALLVASISSWMVITICAYLHHTTKRNCFALWAGGWLFYSGYLVTSLMLEEVPGVQYLMMARYACVGISALYLIAGSLEYSESRPTGRDLVSGSAMVLLWSWLSAYELTATWWAVLPLFVFLAGASVYRGVQYWRERPRLRTGTLLAVGFFLWAGQLLGIPYLGFFPELKAAVYVGASVVMLVVAGLLILKEEVSLSEQKYRGVLDGAKTAIFVVDLWSLRILDANKAAARLTKRSVSDLLNLRILDVCPDLHKGGDNQLEHRAMISAVFKPYNEVHIARCDGALILCEGDTHLVQWHRQPVLQINVQEVDPEAKIGQLVRRAEKMSSLGQLIAGVAHELNNPLAVVVGYAQIMGKQQFADEKTGKNMQKILHESERAAKIVRDLLAFARPCVPQLATTDINQLITELLEVREAELTAHNIRVAKKLAPHLPKTKADALQIEQVLTNLVSNAIHAMSGQTTPRVLTVSTEETGFLIRIAVADTGPGIPAELFGRIFDPFFTTKAPGKGTGLGLSISNTIMQEHRGKIWVQSEAGKGARFFVELPLVTCEEEVKVRTPLTLHERPELPPSRHRLLIVDDEPGIRDVLQEILNGSGYEVDTAGNGNEALERITPGRYDVIISDLCMPEMDGEQFYAKVHDSQPVLAKRMVFVTGDTVSPKSRAFLEATGNRWLSKPFNISDVERVVRDLCRQAPIMDLTADTSLNPVAVRRYNPITN